MPGRAAWVTRLLFANKRVKALSFLLAVITWYSVRDLTSFEVVVPEVELVPQVREGMAVLEQSASRVDVTFRGSQDAIRALEQRRIKAVVNLRDFGAGTEVVSIGRRDIEGARGVQVMQVSPHTVRVTLDREDEKVVPVKGMYTGKPLLGQVETVTCDPPTVRVWGSARKLASTEHVYTAPIDVDGRIQSFVRRTTVLPPAETWVARIDPPEVQVKIDIVQKPRQRELKDVPVLAVLAPLSRASADVRPTQVTITIMGRPESVDATKDNDVKALVDCIGLKAPGEYDVPVYAHVPAEVDLSTTVTPDRVHVVLRELR